MSKHRTIELLIVLVAVVIAPHVPTFLFAGHINADEWLKSGTGVTTSGVILAAYKLWKGRQE